MQLFRQQLQVTPKRLRCVAQFLWLSFTSAPHAPPHITRSFYTNMHFSRIKHDKHFIQTPHPEVLWRPRFARQGSPAAREPLLVVCSEPREGVLFQRHRGEIGGNPKALKAAWRLLRLILYPSQRKQKPPAEPHCAAITAAELRGWRDARMTECLLGTTDFVFTNVCPLKCVSEHKCRWKWLY